MTKEAQMQRPDGEIHPVDNHLIEHDQAALFVTALTALWWGQIILLDGSIGPPPERTVCPCGGWHG
jgi:hypothetical protein